MNFTNTQLKKIIKEEYQLLLQENKQLISALKAALSAGGTAIKGLADDAALKTFLSSPEFRKTIVDVLKDDKGFVGLVKGVRKTTGRTGKRFDVKTLGTRITPDANQLRQAVLGTLEAQNPALARIYQQAPQMLDDLIETSVKKNASEAVIEAGESVLKGGAKKGTVAGSKTLDDAFRAAGAGAGDAVDAFVKTAVKRSTIGAGVLGGVAFLWNSLTGGEVPVEEVEAAVVTDPKKAIETIKKDPEVDTNTKKKAIQKVKQTTRTHKQRRVRVAVKAIGGTPKEAVKKFQDKLLALGYALPKFGADGDYGSETVGAVRQFQASNGLKADGFVGPKTWAAMTSEGAKGPGGVNKSKEKAASDDLGITDLMNDPKRAARVYTYIQNQLRKESSSNRTFKVMPRIRKVQGGFVLKNTGYSANSTDFSAAAMGFLQALVDKKEDAAKVLRMTPDKLMLIIKQGLAVPNDQKDDDSGSTIDPSVLTRGKQNPGLFGKDVTGAFDLTLEEQKSYDIDFGKWSKLWK